MDLFYRFGDIALYRVLFDPTPGTATVSDVVRLDEHHDRLCELIDGTLVRKAMGAYESFLAGHLLTFFNNYLRGKALGITLGEAGMMQLFPEQVRIPDVSFLAWEELKDSGFPEDPVPLMAPTLAVEVISKSNTPQEMDRKLGEYFEAGTKLVWYIYPKLKQVKVYTSPTKVTTLGATDTLTGGDVLPGFSVELKAFFTVPTGGETATE